LSNFAGQSPEDEYHLDERRVQWIAASTLGCVMAGHVLLETACDALFLANVDVERLPFVTIAVAFLALGVSRGSGHRSNRSVLVALQAVAAVGTLGFWSLVAASLEWSYYALFLWSGIITSLIAVRFWLVLGELMTIGQGKRLFAAIAMGGSVGALLGSGLAALLAPSVGGQGLLIASAAAFAASAAGPSGIGSRAPRARPHPADEIEEGASLNASLRDLLGSPYACRIALLVVIGGMTLTLGDYLFKSVLTEEIPADQLAVWLSRIYLGLNVLSIAMLAFGVTPLVRGLGVDRAIVVLPILIGLAGLGVPAGAALAATVFLKLSDGTLRYSLHRTASELLYLPMGPALRTSVKGAIDIVGQTGAKALASILILGIVLAPQARPFIALSVVLFAAAWIAMALRLRQAYLDVFRQTLGDGLIETMIDHPELDLESAGSLIRAISDPDERRALAAMRLLAERGQCDLIPNLIVYHPSPKVVTQALDAFAIEERDDLSHLLGHLIHHEDANVRAASVRAAWALDSALDSDVGGLPALAENSCLTVRASALAGLLARDQIEPDRYRPVLDEVLAFETSEPRLATATAARLRYHPVYREILIRLAGDDDVEVAAEAVRAIRASDDAWFTSGLVDLLGDRRNREGVRRALIERGVSALAVLEHRLVDESTPNSVLLHIPRTIALFETPEAAEVLVASLPRVESGMVRFKLLRGLETVLLERGPGKGIPRKFRERVDLQGVHEEFGRTLTRSLDLLRLEGSLAAGQRETRSLKTVGGQLLVDLLRDKRRLSTGRLFMMLGLMYPQEDYRVIRTGLASAIAAERASAEELVETLLSRDVARGILGLAIEDSIAAQHAAEDPGDANEGLDYAGLVRLILEDRSRSLRAVALYHAAEAGISERVDTSQNETRDEGTTRDPDRLGAKDRGLAAVRDLFERRPRVAARMLLAK